MGAILALFAPRPAHALQKLVLTAGADFPHILAGELDLIYNPHWSIGFNVGGFEYSFPTTPNATPVSMIAGSARVRWFPFGGWFFLGVAGGAQELQGSQTANFAVVSGGQNLTVPATATGSLLSPYVTTYLGWAVVTKAGFSLTLELGYQFDFSSSTNLSATISDASLAPLTNALESSSSFQSAQNDIENRINGYGNLNLPYAALRFGWAF